MKFIALLTATLIVSPSFSAAEPPQLTLQTTIALPGVKGRFDHAAIDPETHRLFFAALGNNTLEVLDVNSGTRLHTITGLRKPTGVLFLAGLNLLVVANGDDGTCRFYDGIDYTEKGRVTKLDDADNLRFDSKANRIYLGYGDGALGVIDPAPMKITVTIPLAKHPESFQLEQNGPRIFVNVPDAGHVAVVDRIKKAVIATWPLTEFKSNFPMALDEKHQRLFIGCRHPARLVVLDTHDGHVVTNVAISGDTDDLFFDAARRLIHLSCGEGFIDIVEQTSADAYQSRGRTATSPGARTCLFNAARGDLFLAVPARGSKDAEVRFYRVAP